MRVPGITASQLIFILQQQIKLHGDCEVTSGGTDYPEGVQGVWYEKRGDSYTPPNSFVIR